MLNGSVPLATDPLFVRILRGFWNPEVLPGFWLHLSCRSPSQGRGASGWRFCKWEALLELITSVIDVRPDTNMGNKWLLRTNRWLWTYNITTSPPYWVLNQACGEFESAASSWEAVCTPSLFLSHSEGELRASFFLFPIVWCPHSLLHHRSVNLEEYMHKSR